MNIYVKLLSGLFLYSIQIGNSQELNSNWKKDLSNSLYQFMACDDPTDDLTPCNIFVGESLKKVYLIDDFYSKKLNRYLLANEIADFLNTSGIWTKLGNCNDQNALKEAQGYANLKKAVVAVLKDVTGQGHIALVLPGDLSWSPSWGLNVPNSASFFLNRKDKSYIDKKLSEAFLAAKKAEVLLYGRNY